MSIMKYSYLIKKISITLLFFTGILCSYANISQSICDWDVNITYVADERDNGGAVTVGYTLETTDQLSCTVNMKTLGLPTGYTAEFFPVSFSSSSSQPYTGTVTINGPIGDISILSF